MTRDEGFIDLRLNRLQGSTEEGFWPSFTDIMTVIVMIFMLAMLILLGRNLELVDQLRATMEAERAAAELAKATGEEKESLAVRLIATENELSMLRMQLMKLEEQQTQNAGEISFQRERITHLVGERDRLATTVSRLTEERGALQDRVGQLSDETARLRGELENSRREKTRLADELARLQERQIATRNELDELRENYRQQAELLEEAQKLRAAAGSELSTLQGEYRELKVKYDKLVRPARTPAGKYVVEVRYLKRGEGHLISLKEPDDEGFRDLSREALDAVLTKRKQEHPEGLYIKVIFPKSSGLSYSEAWGFTSSLHRRYDYYFQEGGEEALAVPVAE